MLLKRANCKSLIAILVSQVIIAWVRLWWYIHGVHSNTWAPYSEHPPYNGVILNDIESWGSDTAVSCHRRVVTAIQLRGNHIRIRFLIYSHSMLRLLALRLAHAHGAFQTPEEKLQGKKKWFTQLVWVCGRDQPQQITYNLRYSVKSKVSAGLITDILMRVICRPYEQLWSHILQ